MTKTTIIRGDIKVIICDIEGTTTPISFVKSILFPYITNNLHTFLSENASKDWFLDFLVEYDIEHLKENLEEEILQLMSVDSKVSWLKRFQGVMWHLAYDNHLVKGQVYPDFPAFLKKYSGIYDIGIYSSGSIQAQKLLFSYTENDGNLLSHLKFHFDTTIGLKSLPSSYLLISQKLKVDPNQILFFSDSPLEIQAASQAGLKTIRVDRDHAYTCNGVVTSFDQVVVQGLKPRKRKIS